jgi:hypothetical protein
VRFIKDISFDEYREIKRRKGRGFNGSCLFFYGKCPYVVCRASRQILYTAMILDYLKA